MSDNLVGFISDNVFLVSLAWGLVIFIVIYESKRLFRKFQEIEPAKAVQLFNHEDTLMLDIRETNELTAGQIDGAKQYPASTFADRIRELEVHKDKPIIAFCSNGLKAVKICAMLTKHGFTNVYHLKGGLTAWTQANLPVTKK